MRQKNKLLLLYADHVFQSATNLLSENSPNSEFFWSLFSRIWTDYGGISAKKYGPEKLRIWTLFAH